MKKLLLAILLFGCTANTVFSQCQITMESSVYEATCFKKLQQPGRGTMSIELSFVDKGNGRVVVKGALSTSTLKYQADDIFLYLEDNSVIKLINRNKHWAVNGESYQIFHLTKSELRKLMKVNISKVRTPARISQSGFSDYSNGGNYDIATEEYSDPINFPRLISNLFDVDYEHRK